MTRTLTTLAAVVALTACTPQDDYVPRLSDLSMDADGQLGLVDRGLALQGALDHDEASEGTALDLAGTTNGYRLSFDGSGVQAPPEAAGRADWAYGNVLAGTAYVVVADLLAAAVVAPPAVAVGIAAAGHIEQQEWNVWTAENTVPWFGQQVTAHLTVAWVGTGWLSEMRLSTSDGALDHALWFNGYLATDHSLGWWDFYDDGELTGSVEWVDDGALAEMGVAVTLGENIGDVVSYTFGATGSHAIDSWDESRGEASWVVANGDGSGEVRLPDYLDGAPACWDVNGVDAACPVADPQ